MGFRRGQKGKGNASIYKRNAKQLAENIEQSNGSAESARIIWNFITDTLNGQKVIADEQR